MVIDFAKDIEKYNREIHYRKKDKYNKHKDEQKEKETDSVCKECV